MAWSRAHLLGYHPREQNLCILLGDLPQVLIKGEIKCQEWLIQVWLIFALCPKSLHVLFLLSDIRFSRHLFNPLYAPRVLKSMLFPNLSKSRELP